MRRVALRAGAFLAICALAQVPPNGALVEKTPFEYDASRLPAAMREAAAATLEQVEISEIAYISDGLRIRGFLAAPRKEGSYPAIVLNRGGNREFGRLTRAQGLVLARMAAWGYVVVASNYRGCCGSEGTDEFGGADVDDVLSLLPLLDAMPNVDGSRIGMRGWSRGGMMTYIALTKTSRIRAAVVGGGPADLFASLDDRPEMGTRVYEELIPGYKESAASREAALRARSMVRWPENLHKQTPILILHGGADWRVSPAEAFQAAQSLLRVKHPFRLVLFEGGDHGLTEHAAEVDRLTREWMDRYVRDGRRWPSLDPHGR
jgi:dipeptidyl aminopeptidase/acylaminoacyl peptidase